MTASDARFVAHFWEFLHDCSQERLSWIAQRLHQELLRREHPAAVEAGALLRSLSLSLLETAE